MRFERNVRVVDTFNGEVVSNLGNSFWLTNVPTRITAVAYFANIDVKGDFNVNVEVSYSAEF